MKPSDVRSLLLKTLPAGLRCMLVGAPGVGKTSILSQVCAELGYDLVVDYTSMKDPTDYGGIGWPDAASNTMRYLHTPAIVNLSRAKKPTVWFLDDFGMGTSAVQASAMQLIRRSEVHGIKIADCVIPVIATNRRQDRANVSGILDPVKSSFESIINVEPDLDDLRNWWLGQGLPVNPIAFASLRWELIASPDAPSAEIQNRPNPRTLEHLARLEMLNLPAAVRAEALSGACGEGFAIEYIAFCSSLANMISIDEILVDPAGATIPQTPAQLYATAIGLSVRADRHNIDNICIYAERLYNAGQGEFTVLTVRDAVRRNPALSATPGCQKIFMGPMRDLIFGANDQ